MQQICSHIGRSTKKSVSAMSVFCTIDRAHETFPAWTPIVLSTAGLPLCVVFTMASCRYHKRIMFGEHSRRRTSCSASSNGVWVRIVYPLRAIWPRTLNQVLATLTTLSWMAMLLDQVAITAYDIALVVICPQFDCRNATMANTPGCIASSIYPAIPTLQTLGYCFFSLASVNRFTSVYSMLSAVRKWAVQLGTGVIITVTVLRLCTLPFLRHMAYVPVSWSSHEFARNAYEANGSQLAITATTLYLLGYFSFFIIVAMADIPCTVLAIQYTMQRRRELRQAHHQGDLGLMTSGKVESTLTAGPSSPAPPPTAGPRFIASVPSEPEKEPVAPSPAASSQRSSIIKRTIMRSLGKRRQQRNRKAEVSIVITRIAVLVGFKVGLLALFVLVRSLFSDKISAHLSTSMMTLTLKFVVAVASMTMTSMTQLVALNR
ncbi:hypothetical protein BCR44DRAFT_401197, partial [Catenaria anguillulae PL171]